AFMAHLLRGRKIPGSKPDSTVNPPCKSYVGDQMPSRWCGADVSGWGVSYGVNLDI
ncbi:hypothetical protein AVEN_141769-1, partial [Araneus ventricosus]